MDCECSAPDGTDSGLECTYPKCRFGEWEDSYRRGFDVGVRASDDFNKLPPPSNAARERPMTDINEAVRNAALRMDAALSRDKRVWVDAGDLGLVLEALASTWPPRADERVTWRDRWHEDTHREWAIENGWTPPDPKERPATRMERVVDDGLNCDGDHHARWYLERIADLLGVPVNERRGIAP